MFYDYVHIYTHTEVEQKFSRQKAISESKIENLVIFGVKIQMFLNKSVFAVSFLSSDLKSYLIDEFDLENYKAI